MATESELRDLLNFIGDRAPSTNDVLGRLALQEPRPLTPPSQRRWLPIGAAIAAVAVAVVVSVTVRGTGSEGGAPAVGSPTPQPTVDRATYSLPLDAYHASATQERTLQRAQFVLAQRCARARGVTVPNAVIPAGDPKQAFLTSTAFNVRPLTMQQARTIGYDMYPSGTSAVDAAVKGLTPEQIEIFQGWRVDLNLPKPTDQFLLDGGCYQQAAQKLLTGATPTPTKGVTSITGLPGLFEDDSTVYDMFVGKAQSGEASPQVASAEKRWSVCMAKHGYADLHITQDAIERAGHTGGLQSARAKRQAVQDVECKQSTGFMTVWVASIAEAQRAVIAANRTQLTQFKKRLATRMDNAAKALK